MEFNPKDSWHCSFGLGIISFARYDVNISTVGLFNKQNALSCLSECRNEMMNLDIKSNMLFKYLNNLL